MGIIDTVEANRQALAMRWCDADEEVRNAQRAVVQVTTEMRNAEQQLEGLSAELSQTVGAHIRTRAFHVGQDVVLVELEKGVRRIRFEVSV